MYHSIIGACMLENLKQLYKYRSLVWALVLRHLSMRYRGSVLGFLWSLLNPLCFMLVYMVVFRYYIRFDKVDNYTIFLFAGLLPWLWVTSALVEGTSAIVSSGHLITKSMFPAHILPAVSIITTLLHFIFSLPLLFVFMFIFGVTFHWTLFLIPLIIISQLLFLYGLSVGLGALNVYYRDVQHMVGHILTFLFFLSPIIYPREAVPANFQFTLDLNPFAVFTMMYHQVILEGTLPSLGVVTGVLGAIVVSLVVGHAIFNYYREGFAEML